jgi:hypothetical protein
MSEARCSKRVLPQPVDDIDDVLVVGVDLLVDLAQFDQLLEVVAQRQVVAVRFVGFLDRLGQAEELRDVLRDVERIGDHAADRAARDLGDLGLPFVGIRVGGGDHQRVGGQFDRQDVEARRVAGRHHIGHLGEIDLQRVDADEGQFDARGQPFAQRVQRQQLVRRLADSSLPWATALSGCMGPLRSSGWPGFARTGP